MRNASKYLALVIVWASGTFGRAQAQGPALDPTFAITSAVGNTLATFPYIKDMVRQPDGKLIVFGDFVSVNNTPVPGICRLLINGQVDASFTAAAPNGRIASMALQVDGKLLIGGRFTEVGGQPRNGLARLLPSGTLEVGFDPPFDNTATFPNDVDKIVVQPGIGIVVIGDMIFAGAVTRRIFLTRLTEATGALDPTFQPGFTTFATNDVLVRPNNHLVFSGSPHTINGQQCGVWGTLPNGALDPTFVPLPGLSGAEGLVPDPNTGNIYVVQGTTPGVYFQSEPLRLLPNGTPDPSFRIGMGSFIPASRQGGIFQLAVQPNGRLLLAGDFPLVSNPNLPSDFAGSWRLLPSGARDPSYQPANGPGAGARKVLVQPDGKLVFAGFFDTAGGFSLQCLARMLDPNVLSARAPGPADENALTAWPVPAHDALHLRLPAGRPPRQAQLLDALGRVVRRQALAPAELAPALPTAGLPPGGYLLRVDFGQGPPAYRRVVLE